MANLPDSNLPRVSVVIPTRNRGRSVVDTVASILANTNPSFELLVIDQSTNDDTRQALAPFQSDPRLRYIPYEARGTGRSRNLGLQKACGEYVLYTDDDCIVPPDWIDRMRAVLDTHPRAGVVFCDVAAGAYDSTQGFTPEYRIQNTRLIKHPLHFLGGIGIGAGMALRREVIRSIGGFDINMGPGSICFSAEDHDVALRAVFNGWWVVHTPETCVTHYGFRTWQEGVLHAKRDFSAIGAAFMKLLRCGKPGAIFYLLSAPVFRAISEPFWGVFRGRMRGFRRAYYLLSGIVLGAKIPVDRKKMLFVVEDVQ